MSRDWSVVGRSTDPAPGDPYRVRGLGDRLVHNAEMVERNTVRLRGIAASGGDLGLEGDFAPAYLQALGELPGELEKLGRAYRACGEAMRSYAGELETARAHANQAYNSGSDASSRVQTAVRQIRTQAPPEAAELQYARVFMDHGQSERVLVNITDAAIQSTVRQAVLRARTAEGDRRAAARLAEQAASLHHDAEERAAHRIDDALNNSGIKNLSWWEKAWNFVSAPFRSWDAFIQLVQIVAIVVTVLALIIGGPILGAILLVLSVVLLANVLYQYSQGRASLFDVGMELIGFIPGGRALAALGRTLRASRTIMRVAGPLRRAFTSIPHGFNIAGGLRGALQNPSLFGRALRCRFLGRDPVDMASGEMILVQTDITLPAASMPLVVERMHTTSYRVGRLFGPAWSSPLDQRLEIDSTGAYYSSRDGMLQRFPFPESDAPVFADAGERFELRSLPDGTFTVTDPQAGQTLHFGEIPGTDLGMFNLTRIVDRNDNAIEFDYAIGGVLTTIRHYGGYTIDVVTDEGLVTAFRLRGGAGMPDQDLVRYGYNPAGMLTDVINSSGRPLTFGYDDEGRIVSWTDRNGAWYRYGYDAAGRCVGTQGSDGILNGSIVYDEANGTTVETNSLGHATTYHINENYQIERVVDPLGNATRRVWDRYNRLLSETDPLGHTTSYTRDDAGNITRIDRPDSTRVSSTFNELNLPVRVVAPDEAVWRLEYDDRGNLVSTVDPIGGRMAWTYDNRGHVVTSVDAMGAAERYETNDAGLLVSVTDRVGATTACLRDGLGRVRSITDPMGSTTHLSWTLEGRMAARTMPDGATERWIYDAEGNLTEHVNAVGAITRYEIAGFDQPAVRTNADGSRLAYAYDTELRLVAVTNPQGLVWRYKYDPAGRLIGETDYNGRTVTSSYDAAGNLVGRTNGVGQTLRHERDAMGRLVQSVAEDAVTAYRYDRAGRMVAASNTDSDLHFTYDAAGRLVSEIVNGRTVQSEYDAAGNRVARVTPSGARTEWSYDAVGQIQTMATAGRTVRFGLDLLGRETVRAFGAAQVAQTWDGNSRMVAQTVTGPAGQLVQHRAYSYRPDDHLTAVHDHLTGSRFYDLDIRGRVGTVRSGEAQLEMYTYDAAGSTHQAVWPAPPESDAAEEAGLREYAGTRIRLSGRVRYEHDDQGRITLRQRKVHSSRPQNWRYSWDAYDRLTAVTTPDGTMWTYQYDALGRRISKTRLGADGAAAQRTDFTWDGQQLAEQLTSDGVATTWEYDPLTFNPVSQTDRRTYPGSDQGWYDERFYAIVTDLIGTPAELLDADGTVVWQRRQMLWGPEIWESRGQVDCPLRFPGQYYDPESQLHYNLFRYYEPAAARYASNDPVGLVGGDDPHQYVSNPLTWLDPLGLTPSNYFPNITQAGLLHSFSRHAAQWFGRDVTRAAKMGEWQSLIERAAGSTKIVPWSSGGTQTFAHLARIDGKWFLAQFDRGTGDLVTAFVPNSGQLGAVLRLLGH